MTDTAPDPPRVAVTDVDGKVANGLAERLTAKGYAALAWRWGNGMLAMLARERPHLAIIDVDARRHGALWLVLRHLGNDPGVRDIPIVLCAAAATTRPARYARVLIRPVEPRDLLRAVEAVVGPPPGPKARVRASGVRGAATRINGG